MLADVRGPTRVLLTAQRTALNIMRHLSGVATTAALMGVLLLLGASFVLANHALAAWIGLPAGEALLDQIGAERIFLDGLVSVWQPDANR